MWHASRPNWLTALCQAGQPSPRSPYRPDQFPPALGSDLLGPVVGDIDDLDIRLLGCGGIGAWFLDPSPFTVSTSPVGVPPEYRILLARVKPGLALPTAAPDSGEAIRLEYYLPPHIDRDAPKYQITIAALSHMYRLLGGGPPVLQFKALVLLPINSLPDDLRS